MENLSPAEKMYQSHLANVKRYQQNNPEKMASAMNLAVKAGRLGYLAGRMEKKYYANASSPLKNISQSFS